LDLDLKGKKAIVTGGTRGIGRAIAELLADEGCDLAVCARGRAGIDETRAALASKGVKAFGGTVDVADRQSLRGWVEEAAGLLGSWTLSAASTCARDRATYTATPECGSGLRRSPPGGPKAVAGMRVLSAAASGWPVP
jgi:NAD(P)-dependent dehydrogenase (short-subunit alcohol dehydrogenase family)